MASYNHDDYMAAWICALPLELAAACAMLDERHDALPLERDSRDNNSYILGRVARHNVVIACLPSGITGTISAARVVNQMLSTFRQLKFGLMVGIGGGAPSEEHDIRLGDVVVGKPAGLLGGVVQYDFGKTMRGQFKRTGMLNKPPELLLTALSHLQARHFMEGHKIENAIQQMVNRYPVMRAQYTRPSQQFDRLYKPHYEHPENRPTCSACDPSRLQSRVPRSSQMPQLHIHYGLIASGDQVVRHGAMREKLRKELDILCFEMEAAGLVDSFPCLVIRGISDYADSHKNDLWQGYAAAAAAAYAKELMSVIPLGYVNNYLYTPVRMNDRSAGDLRFLVHQWLSPTNTKEDLFSHQRDYMDGSCDWALQTEELKSFFMSRNETEILRIGGTPGSGKSTLTAFIISHLMQAANSSVVYFFCKGTDENKREPFQVLRTLISQLLTTDGEYRLLPWVDKLRLESGQKHAESFVTLYEAFKNALAIRSADKTLHIIIDALDECQDGYYLTSSLINSLDASKRPFKLLLTSREEPDLVKFFHWYQGQSQSPLSELITLPSRVQQPIVAYVRKRVSQCQHINATALGERVFREVSVAADGLWLYARLILDEIERLPSAASVARQLQNIPNGLVQLYQTIFMVMEKALSALELKLAQQVFLWVDMVDFVKVGRAALDQEILDIVFQAANSGEEVFDSIDLARKICSPLVVLKEAVSYRNAGLGGRQCAPLKISYVHHTAMQFIRQSANREVNNAAVAVPTILKLQALRGLYRAKTAVWYFENCAKSTFLLADLHYNGFSRVARVGAYFEMSYGLWNAFFLRMLPECLDDDELAQASVLCNTLSEFLLSGRCLKWVEMAIIINYEGGFVNLFDNVINALSAAEHSTIITNGNSKGKLLPAFQLFAGARKYFFADYAYVISLTGPTDGQEISMPEEFHNRPLASSLLRLGQRWTHLYHNLDLDS